MFSSQGHGIGRSNFGQDAFYGKIITKKKKKDEEEEKVVVGEKQLKFSGTLNFFGLYIDFYVKK